jgi:hypothetical protein
MKRLFTPGLILAIVGMMAFACGGSVPGGDKLPGGGMPGGGGKVDPSACGGMNMNDATKNLKGFLGAALELEGALNAATKDLAEVCAAMGTRLGLEGFEGNPETDCPKVVAAISENLKVGLKAGATLNVVAKPAVCEVNVDAAVSAAASCSGSASGSASATCSGTCEGECAGECQGATGEGGQCDGVCKGECKGNCNGHVDVEAEASCEAQAEVKANVDAKCTPPEVTVEFEASAVVDKPKVEAAVAALKEGLPVIMRLQGHIGTPDRPGPLLGASITLAASAKELVKSVGGMKDALKDQFLCVSGQLKAAADLAASIQSKFSASVDVSVSVSASASVSGEAG